MQNSEVACQVTQDKLIYCGEVTRSRAGCLQTLQRGHGSDCGITKAQDVILPILFQPLVSTK